MSLVEAPVLVGSFFITVEHYRNYVFLILEDVKQKFLPNYLQSILSFDIEYRLQPLQKLKKTTALCLKNETSI